MFREKIAVESSTDKFISFDVFDTLIVRSVPAKAILEALSARMLELADIKNENASINDLLQLRSLAWQDLFEEKKASNLPSEDGLSFEMMPFWIKRIQNQFKCRDGFNKELRFELSELEEKMELFSIRPVLTALEEVRALKNQGFKLIFVSDMYLRKSIIEEMLNSCGYKDIFSMGYVSGEIGLLKRTGNLFNYIKEQKITISCHFGDDEIADSRMPHATGISGVQILSPEVKSKRRQAQRFWKAQTKNPELASFSMYANMTKSMKLSRQNLNDWSMLISLFCLKVAKHLEFRDGTMIFPAREGLFLKAMIDRIRYVKKHPEANM